MKITIVRHAEPDYKNKTLTQKGFREADLLGRYLSGEKIDYIYCSPLPRAKYTADAIVKYNKNKNYEVIDSFREFNYHLLNLPYKENHLLWDLRASFLQENLDLYDKDKWTENKYISSELKSSYIQAVTDFLHIIEKHGYKKDGVGFKVEKPNRDHIYITCHFGLGSLLMAELLNVSPNALLNHTCLVASSYATFVTEEREEGLAIFRMLSFGNVEHLIYNGEEPSFMARFDEIYGDGIGEKD